MKLLLFDIDGTLLTTDEAGRVALKMATRDVFGFEEDLVGITISGNTDTGIVREILVKHSVPVTEGSVGRLIGGYLVRLTDNLSTNPGTILPGVLSFLEQAELISCAIGLLTGNLRRGAHLKLAAHGLHDRFHFGAFADDHHQRNELGPIAKTRAEAKYHQIFEPDDILVIGDTPRDIACGKAFGARTVAVATGYYSFTELQTNQPDFLFENLSNTQVVLKALELI